MLRSVQVNSLMLCAELSQTQPCGHGRRNVFSACNMIHITDGMIVLSGLSHSKSTISVLIRQVW